jgi:N6-adenosine-specific RNA methylase IME4
VQRDLIERAKGGEKVTAKHVAKKLQRDARESDLASATQAASQKLGEKRYGVLYADPPWRFEVYAESGMDRTADNHYPTMTIEEIKAFPIPAADDCILFLWATVPMLPQAIEVLQAWGFTYKSGIVWEKDRPGTGYWVQNTVEHLLIGTRGNVPAPTPGEQPPQVIKAPRGRHSEKPAIFAEHIERLYPNTPKLEMFARTARPGWDVSGNEAPTSEETA